MMKRRNLLAGGAALAAGGAVYAFADSRLTMPMTDAKSRTALRFPPLIDTVNTGKFLVTAQSDTTSFFPGHPAETIGFNQAYLGPVVRMKKGSLRPTVENNLAWPVSSHWHGLLVPGEHDGGPHLAIETGGVWSPDMEIAQEPCTAFFHTHIHGRTARDVYSGLAGVLHVVDGLDRDRGLPESYAVDDLTLLLQDRRFSQDGKLLYANSMMDIMHGMTGETIVVNGQVGAVAAVPKAVVRLRLINGSNARIYSLFSSDDRPIHLIATDGGYLPAPVQLETLRLGPGERAEILVDFSDGNGMSLMSGGDPNAGMGGMMGKARGLLDDITGSRQFEVLPFRVDERLAASVTRIPDAIGGNQPDLRTAEISKVRNFSLDMGMGGGMMGSGGMGRGMMSGMAINGQLFDMSAINERVRLGDTEKWVVSTSMLAHPFHIHGVSFQVFSENGREPRPESLGWKDTVVVDSQTELLVHFTKPASEETPFMYHCHILEHEDAGMMGQFTVS
ncbi:multicopper oxidase domain-containing protein [uncultured Hoeflea sp.]|uniref:multicopper oxidase family protein n=1 Tax=uncultured Hoeflea sp. TaxID=538666 RepID=UPI0030D88C6E